MLVWRGRHCSRGCGSEACERVMSYIVRPRDVVKALNCEVISVDEPSVATCGSVRLVKIKPSDVGVI